jgi:DNA-binding NarL/FixJ family response regulator
MTRVALFTDEPILAAGFTSILASAPEFTVTSVCRTAAELVEMAEVSEPELLLIDLTREVNFGVLTELRRRAPNCRIVLWVREISPELAHQAMQAGVRGVLRKVLPSDLLVKCLTRVSEGELWLDKNLTANLLTAKLVPLTRREGQLVSLLSQGLKNKEIANELCISEGTVKVYLSRLFQKVGAKDRFELALYGLRNFHNIGADFASVPTRIVPEWSRPQVSAIAQIA